MKKYEQAYLYELIEAIDPTILLNTPDVYALGLLVGKVNLAKELGYEFSDKELSEANNDYFYLRCADREDELGTLYTNRMDIHITYLKKETTLEFTADGIKFICEQSMSLQWCADIVVEDAVPFESVCFFYNDWLEDVLETVVSALEVSEHSVRYELFACNIAKDLTIA